MDEQNCGSSSVVLNITIERDQFSLEDQFSIKEVLEEISLCERNYYVSSLDDLIGVRELELVYS